MTIVLMRGNPAAAGGVEQLVEGRPPAEEDLVLLAQRGDERAFEALVRAEAETAFRVAFLVIGDAAEAEDAVQEAYVKAWRALGRFRRARPFRPWLLRIVANEARNRRRAAGRRGRLTVLARSAQVSGDAAPSPEHLVIVADEQARLLAALDTLPEQARLVLCCRYLLGLSEAETAAALGVRVGTVKSRSARALARLRETYA